MSVSDDSTLFSSRDNDESQFHDGQTNGIADLPVTTQGKSPYTDPEIISLDVGPTQTRYRIHRTILAQSPELASKPSLKLWGEKTNDTLSLPDLDPVTAHTLIHYLYTGHYQTLESSPSSTEAPTLAAYKLSTCVYCAAMRYKLPALAALAQEKIMALGQELGILEILRVARECAFPALPAEGEDWFCGYVEGAIRGAVRGDPGLCVREGFVDLMEGDSRRFRQVVMMAVVNSYSGGGVVRDVEGEGERKGAVVDGGKEVGMQERERDGVVEVADGKEKGDYHPVLLDDIEPIVPSPGPAPAPASAPLIAHSPSSSSCPPPPQAPESFTDELGFKNSKMYKNQSIRRTSSSDTNSPLISNSNANTTTTHARHDSAVQVELNGDVAAPVAGEREKDGVALGSERVNGVEGVVDANGGATVAKKSKKKKGKKGAAAGAA